MWSRCVSGVGHALAREGAVHVNADVGDVLLHDLLRHGMLVQEVVVDPSHALLARGPVSRLTLLVKCQTGQIGACRFYAALSQTSHFRSPISFSSRREIRTPKRFRFPAHSEDLESWQVAPPLSASRCRANMAHTRQSTPDSGLGVQIDS